jgi:antitoxin HicB
MSVNREEIDAQVEALLRRPYRKVITGDPAGGFVARAPELPGCITEGDTETEALEMLLDAMAGWFGVALERGVAIPEPMALRTTYNGRILVRTSKTLHRRLAEHAGEEGVSLNQLIVASLAEALGDHTSA